jgi:hypothetical protein
MFGHLAKNFVHQQCIGGWESKAYMPLVELFAFARNGFGGLTVTALGLE